MMGKTRSDRMWNNTIQDMASVIGGFKVGSEEITALVWICDKERRIIL